MTIKSALWGSELFNMNEKNETKNNIESFSINKPDDNLKQNESELNQNKQNLKTSNIRNYLEEKVLQTLTSGLEELLKEVNNLDKRRELGEENVSEIQPIYFLAKYLLQNSENNSKSIPHDSMDHSSYPLAETLVNSE